jgi:hypothetical protein
MKTNDGNTKTDWQRDARLAIDEIIIILINRSQGIREQYRQEIIQPAVFCQSLTSSSGWGD